MKPIEELKNKIIQGDCIEKLKTLPENSVDSIVTDPPYELGFMGKKWDSIGIAYNKDMWAECLRVLKPGGYLLSFGGTRTYHRMACAIEDAGFEVRDMIEWVYGSGFPKSLNISKAIEKMNGVEPLEKIPNEGQRFYGQEGSDYHLTPNRLVMPKTQTEDGKKWEGWGTALKPAHEPIVVARKPLSEKSVAENVLKWGTGGINIDESRVGTTGARNNGNSQGTVGSNSIGVYGKAIKQDYNMGRFPANLIHDNSEEVRECFPEAKGGAYPKERGKSGIGFASGKLSGDQPAHQMGDSGNASRFFKSILYYPKASKSERNKGCEELPIKSAGGLQGRADGSLGGEPVTAHNNHPTVKPIALMEYLIKMVTPKGGIVLDPFAGSGSTCMAAKKIGRDFIGIEKEEEYVRIAKARIKSISKSLPL